MMKFDQAFKLLNEGFILYCEDTKLWYYKVPSIPNIVIGDNPKQLRALFMINASNFDSRYYHKDSFKYEEKSSPWSWCGGLPEHAMQELLPVPFAWSSLLKNENDNENIKTEGIIHPYDRLLFLQEGHILYSTLTEHYYKLSVMKLNNNKRIIVLLTIVTVSLTFHEVSTVNA